MLRARRLLGTAALLLTIVLGTALATVPTPLYSVYTDELGLDSLGVTATFAAFAGGAVVGLVIAVLLARRLSRRNAFVAAGILQCAAALILAADLGLGGFFVGRITTGLGAGLLAASGTAFILELAGALPARVGAVLRPLAPAFAFLGLGTGPAIAAVAGPATLAHVHALFAALATAIAASLLAAVGLLPRGAGRGLPPAGASERLPAAAAVGAFTAFMSTGLFGSLTTLLLGQMGITSTAFAGGFAALVFVSGAVGVALVAPRVTLRVAALLLACTLIAVAATSAMGVPVLLVVSAALAGAAGGALFARSLRLAVSVAPHAAFRQTSLVFVFAYLGLAVPVLGLGLTLRLVPTEPAIWGFSLVALVLCLVTARFDTRVSR